MAAGLEKGQLAVKHRKPSRAHRAVVSTSLPLATVAVVATLVATSAGAAPVDPSALPTTPTQPGNPPAVDGSTATTENQFPAQPGVTTPGTQQPGPQHQGGQQPDGGTPQPGVTTPNPNGGEPNQNLFTLVQPGVTTPRVAPLPVPGPQPGQDSGTTEGLTGNGAAHQGARQPKQPTWSSPSLQSAPAAPVVPMDGPHIEAAANIDGGGVLPGYVANTHHFNNANGYVGTIGYRTPTGTGDAGVSIEYVEANEIKVTTYTHTTGIDDLKARTGFDDVKNETYIDSTPANAAKAAVEGWIRMQPGGAAALDAAAQVCRPRQGNYAPQTVSVAGVTTQWSGSVQN
jgi:hypothetical protein